MKVQIIHTSSPAKADGMWLMLGGKIAPVRRTGEKRYTHQFFPFPLTINGRREDVPAKLLSRINQLVRASTANDDRYSAIQSNPA